MVRENRRALERLDTGWERARGQGVDVSCPLALIREAASPLAPTASESGLSHLQAEEVSELVRHPKEFETD
jgi:hypothetical protein